MIMPTSTQSGFMCTLARPVLQAMGEHSTLVHLWWQRDVTETHVVQVYVDERLYDVVEDAFEGQTWIVLNRSQAHRIELIAVAERDAWREQAHRLASWRPGVRDIAKVGMLRDERLEVDTVIHVSADGQSLDESLLWPSDAHRGGFGALFGEGGFGVDAVTGVGLGVGELGHGPLGADGFAWHWRHDRFASGMHALTLEPRDRTGRLVSMPIERVVEVEHLASPARAMTLDQAFTLSWQ